MTVTRSHPPRGEWARSRIGRVQHGSRRPSLHRASPPSTRLSCSRRGNDCQYHDPRLSAHGPDRFRVPHRTHYDATHDPEHEYGGCHEVCPHWCCATISFYRDWRQGIRARGPGSGSVDRDAPDWLESQGPSSHRRGDSATQTPSPDSTDRSVGRPSSNLGSVNNAWNPPIVQISNTCVSCVRRHHPPSDRRGRSSRELPHPRRRGQ